VTSSLPELIRAAIRKQTPWKHPFALIGSSATSTLQDPPTQTRVVARLYDVHTGDERPRGPVTGIAGEHLAVLAMAGMSGLMERLEGGAVWAGPGVERAGAGHLHLQRTPADFPAAGSAASWLLGAARNRLKWDDSLDELRSIGRRLFRDEG
jgi:hypothetical protein